MKYAIGLLIFSSLLLATPVSAEETKWSCPDKTDGRLAFMDGTMEKWPNYSESHGARVQRQFPNTAFTGAQAKYVDWSSPGGASCQYYSHIGLVATSIVIGAERDPATPICNAQPCPEGPYWRAESTESTPDLDRPGKEKMWVCMEDQEGLAVPSTGCGFVSSSNGEE